MSTGSPARPKARFASASMAYACPITAARPSPPARCRALVSHQAGQPQPGRLLGDGPQLDRLRRARHTAAAEPDVDVDQHGDRGPRGPGRGAERLGRLRRVDGRADGGAAGQGGEPSELARVDHLVRHQHVGGPGVDHGLRLADRGAGQAGGARRQLAERERGGAVRLHVRADLLRCAAAPSLGGGDVRLEGAHVHDEHGRREGRCVHRCVSTRPGGRGTAIGYAAPRHATTARARSSGPVTTPASPSPAAQPPRGPAPRPGTA